MKCLPQVTVVYTTMMAEHAVISIKNMALEGGCKANSICYRSLPQEAFTDEKQLFEGAGVDGVYLLPTHKAHQFLGMSPLPTFMCNDVIKAPDIEQYAHDYRQHLSQLFGSR